MLPAGRTPSEHVADAPVHLAPLDCAIRFTLKGMGIRLPSPNTNCCAPSVADEPATIEAVGAGDGDRLTVIIVPVTALVRAKVAVCHENAVGDAGAIPALRLPIDSERKSPSPTVFGKGLLVD